MAKKKQRCARCGKFWPPFPGRVCFDCAHQVELPLLQDEVDLAGAEPDRIPDVEDRTT